MTPAQCAVELVRRAIDAGQTGDPADLERAVRRHLDGQPRAERNRIVGALALIAGSLAGYLTPERRDQVLARWQGTDEQLVAAAAALFWADTAATGGRSA